MAEKRMFAKSIVMSDAFLDMPLSARCLYFTLGMLADDDGFVGNPKSIMRQCGASQDDMLILLQKRYVLAFESGVIVIKHWKINNYLRSDRYVKTTYCEELSTLTTDEKGAYIESNRTIQRQMESSGIPGGIPSGNPDKNSIDKNSKDKNRVFVPPTREEVTAYCKERKSSVDPDTFYDYFTEGGWVDSKGNKVKNWKQKLLTWEKYNTNKPVAKKNKFADIPQAEYDISELEKQLLCKPIGDG